MYTLKLYLPNGKTLFYNEIKTRKDMRKVTLKDITRLGIKQNYLASRLSKKVASRQYLTFAMKHSEKRLEILPLIRKELIAFSLKCEKLVERIDEELRDAKAKN